MDVLEAVGDVHRRRIVELVAGRERSAGEIAEQFEITRPAVSQHLQVLVAAGVLDVRRVGRTRRYSLRPQALSEIGNWLEAQQTQWAAALDSLEQTIADDERIVHDQDGQESGHAGDRR